MSLFMWIGFGVIAGFIASQIVKSKGQGTALNIILGIAGAIIGGWIFTAYGGSGPSDFNFYSLIVAVVGAVLLLVSYHVVSRLTH